MVLGLIQNFVAEKFVVMGKVCHSQKLNNLLVSLWIISERNGKIQSAHCRGWIAGQGECCAHIASVFFYLETFNRVPGTLACTELNPHGLCRLMSKTCHIVK